MMKTEKSKGSELLRNSKVLIVDDDRTIRLMLRNIFENCGVKNIEEAVNGEEGWQKTINNNPDLIILDINMPVMDGIQYCKKARKNPNFKETPIIVITGFTDIKTKAKIFESGATDYVSKPLDLMEIVTRSTLHIERILQVRELESYNKRVKQQLFAAGQLLEDLLPSSSKIRDLKSSYNIDLASKFESSDEMGGDFWGFHHLDENRIVIYCYDLSGHGLDSALNAMRLHSVLHTNINKYTDPGEIITWLNKSLLDLLPAGQFSTMFYGIIDIKNNKLEYTTSAVPSFFIIRDNKLPAEKIENKGFPLGALAEASFKTKSIDFNPGDSLLIYSDGLTEAEDKKTGKMLGDGKNFQNMLKYLVKEQKNSSKAALKAMIDQFHNKYGRKLEDDLTVNIYHRIKT